MKKYVYLLLLAASFISCRKVSDERSPTVITGAVQPDPSGPAYIPPSCSPGSNKIDADVLNFMISFPPVPELSIDKGTLKYYNKNSNDDEITIILHPFVKGQSTVYTLTGVQDNLSEYQAYVELNANAMGPDKFLGKYSSAQNRKIHLNYNEASGTYTLVFCESQFLFKYPSGGGQTYEDISSKFVFNY